MVKPVKTVGKTQRQQIAMAQSKKTKRRPGVAALKEIRKQQKSTKLSIPKSSFKDLVMQITVNVLADRSDTQGRRRTKNSQGGQRASSAARASTSGRPPSASGRSPSNSSSKSPKKAVKKEVKKEVKSEIKSEVKREIKSERSPARSRGKPARSAVKKEAKKEIKIKSENL